MKRGSAEPSYRRKSVGLALGAVKASIRARGDKVQLYSLAQLRAQADGMIGPWLVAQAKARIVERNLQVMQQQAKA